VKSAWTAWKMLLLSSSTSHWLHRYSFLDANTSASNTTTIASVITKAAMESQMMADEIPASWMQVVALTICSDWIISCNICSAYTELAVLQVSV